jgi:hypothetical protein
MLCGCPGYQKGEGDGMLNTTFAKLKEAEACTKGYKKLAEYLGGVKTYGKDTLISLNKILESNGLDDTIWTLRCTVEPSEDFIIEFACRCAEYVLKNYESLYPDDKRPRQAIEAARKCITDKSEAAKSAAKSAARSAARSATWSAESAESAARSAAWSAGSAGSAAWSAESAARSAAWSAGSAAWSAAWSAESAESAGSAAWSAESAARSAAWSAESAGSAAREWQTQQLKEMLEVTA